MNDDDFLDDNTIDPAARTRAAQKSTWVSVLTNAALSGAQVSTGLFSGSQGLVADGIHSLSDLVADFVVLVANHHSHKEADENHPYGHYRFENAASLAIGLILLLVGAGMVISAINKIQRPGTLPEIHIMALWMALAALVAKELLFRYMLYVAKKVRSSMLTANAWHARSDAASSLVVAGGIVFSLLGYRIVDPIAALIVGLIICKMGFEFAFEALHILMDRSADLEVEQTIKNTLMATPGIQAFHDFKTRKVGDFVIVDVHLEVDGALSVAEGHAIAVEARRRVMDNHEVLNVMTHIDPVSDSD